MSIPRSLDLPPNVRHCTVETARGPFAALQTSTADAAGTPVVLVPGYTGSKEDFLAVLGPLGEAGYAATAIDLRGQYQTAGSDDPAAYELEELALDVLAVVDAVGGSAHLVGHSFGGFVTRSAAQLAATGRPERLHSLTLMDSGPGEVTGEGTRTNLTMLAGALPTYDMETIWQVKRSLEHGRGDPVQPPAIEEFLHTRFVSNHPVALRVAAGQLLAPVERSSALAELALRTLVLYGAAEDVWSPTEIAAMAERVGARTAVIAAAGHSPAVDNPTATVDALVTFWTAGPE